MAKQTSPFNALDPEQVGPRLYRQVSALLTQLEAKDSRDKVTMRERIAALVAVGRLQQIFATLRKIEPPDDRSGSTVKKYATAFAAPHAVGGRKTNTRPEPEPDDWFEHADVESEADDTGTPD